MATATRKVKGKEVDVEDPRAPATEKKRTRISHAVPAMGKPMKVTELVLRPNSSHTKYTEIVETIRGLKLKEAVTFEPVDDETVEALKTRISSLVSRSCSKSAKPGTKYQTRITENGEVCVFLDTAKESA